MNRTAGTGSEKTRRDPSGSQEYSNPAILLSFSSNSSTVCGCEEVYFYLISAPQLVNVSDFYIGTGDNYVYVYQSIESVFNKNQNDCNDNTGSFAAPTFSIGEQYQCWRPSNPGDELPGAYKCGNDECIKVFDPQNDADAAEVNAKAMWISGAVLLGLILPMCCVSGYLRAKIPGRGPTTNTFP
jgi:hypothetical protein